MIARGSTRLTEPGDQLALAVRELVEDLVALDLAHALEDDLLRGLGADAAEVLGVELLDLDHVAGLGVVLGLAGLVDRDLDHRVLDLVDDVAAAIDVDLAAVRLDADEDVLLAGDAAVGGLDALLDARISASWGTCFSALSWSSAPTKSRLIMRLPAACARWRREPHPTRRNVGWSPTSGGGLALLAGSIHPGPWTATISHAQQARPEHGRTAAGRAGWSRRTDGNPGRHVTAIGAAIPTARDRDDLAGSMRYR